MKILLLSDKESPYLWDYYQPGRLSEYDLIISCGDLSPSYLSFIVTLARAPVVYVHGNHDGKYAAKPPEGCDCIEDTLFVYKGVRILGLGGTPVYNGGPHQYTEAQMRRRARRLRWKIWKAGGVDIIVTHAPVAGYGDGEDFAHRGYACLAELIDRYHPKFLVHGHVHLNYGMDLKREYTRDDTRIVNAFERYVIEI